MTTREDGFNEFDRALLELEAEWIRRREQFYERALAPTSAPGVFHWDDDFDPHIDVYLFGPGPYRSHDLLITGGMADRPMPGVPPRGPVPRRIEVLFELPAEGDWAPPVLREIAAIPFLHGVVLSSGALIQGSRPIRKGSTLRHVVLGPAGIPALEGFVVEGEPVSFLRAHFVTEREFGWGRERGGIRLLEKLARAEVGNVLRWRRRSAV